MDNNIRALRMARNMTQAELARRVGVTQVQMHYIERGRRKLTLETAIKLAAALGCKVEKLKGGINLVVNGYQRVRCHPQHQRTDGA